MGRGVVEEVRAPLDAVDGAGCVEVDMDRGAKDVPRRALKTISSGLGTSKAKLCEEVVEAGGGISVRLCVLRRGLSMIVRCSRVRALSFCLGPAPTSCPREGRESSSVSMDANADGVARDRGGLEANIGRSNGARAGSGSACFWSRLLFIASLDCFGSDVFGANISSPRDDDFERSGCARLPSV